MARRAVPFVRGKRMATDWSVSVPQVSLVAVAASTSALLQTFTPIAGGETVIRIRGLFGWRTDQSGSDEEQMGAVGICKVSEPAATLGITALPTPDTDATWGGWLWHFYYVSWFESVSVWGFSRMTRLVSGSRQCRGF